MIKMSLNKLYTAAERGDLVAVNQLLSARGVDVNKSGVYQQSPLFIAAMKGHTAIVDRLLTAGANKDKPNVNQATPLYIAALGGHLPIVERLLAAGANKEKPNSKQATPLFAAAMNGHLAVVERLLTAGADKEKSNVNHATPLFIASENGRAEIVERLLAAGANKEKPNINQATPLFIAAANGHKRVVDRLLSAGANKEKPNGVLQTPLMAAAAAGHKDAVMALLKDGADLNKRDKTGQTALQIAKKAGHMEIVELIEPSPKWKGWSRSDVDQLNTLFETKPDTRGRIPADNVSVCPVCLKTIVRGEACMYMSHNCKDLPGFYHEELYAKYKDKSGRIGWCTICNRACSGHRHYQITPANAPKAAEETQRSGGADAFGGENDCRKYGGGGREEKIMRIRRMREYAFELNQDIGKITHKTAMSQLVEEMWNSPYYRTRKVQNILQSGKWNIQTNEFPVYGNQGQGSQGQGSQGEAPNVPYPFANKPQMFPIIDLSGGTNVISLNDVPVVIHFVHREINGNIRIHQEAISIQSLFETLEQRFGGSGTPKFGKCLFDDGCTGIHYPAELQYVLDKYPGLSQDEREKYQQMITNYKKRFNEAYRENETFKERIDKNIHGQIGGRRRKTYRRLNKHRRTRRRR
jgi:ankyrin repeat protein